MTAGPGLTQAPTSGQSQPQPQMHPLQRFPPAGTNPGPGDAKQRGPVSRLIRHETEACVGLGSGTAPPLEATGAALLLAGTHASPRRSSKGEAGSCGLPPPRSSKRGPQAGGIALTRELAAVQGPGPGPDLLRVGFLEGLCLYLQRRLLIEIEAP